MNRFYILTYCDAEHYGLGVTDVLLFDDEELAIKEMEQMYIEKCKEENIENPFSDDSYDYQYRKGYAFISDKYYWDIFVREL